MINMKIFYRILYDLVEYNIILLHHTIQYSIAS